MKVTKISYIGNRLYAHICPLCGAILAAVSEKKMMPEFSICDCDRTNDKKTAYELYTKDGYTMIRRNKPPRFIGKVTFGKFSDIEDIQWMDAASAMDMAKALRKAGEFLIKSSNHD